MKVEVSGICTETLPVSLSGEPHVRNCFQVLCAQRWALAGVYGLPPKWPLEAISDFLHVHVLSGAGGQIGHLEKGAFLMPCLARLGQPSPSDS